MIWLFKIVEEFWDNKPKVDEHYVFPKVDDIEFDITLYDISLYIATDRYFLLNDVNPDEIYYLQYSGTNSNPSRLLVGKNTDYYNDVRNYYIDKSKQIKEDIELLSQFKTKTIQYEKNRV